MHAELNFSRNKPYCLTAYCALSMFASPTHFLFHHYGTPDEMDFVVASAHLTREASDDLARGDISLARTKWASVDGPALLDLWNEMTRRIRSAGPRWSLDRPRSVSPIAPPVSKSMAKKVYERDKYVCRYCNTPVFTRWAGSSFRQLVSEFPDLTPNLTVEGNVLRGTGLNGSLRNADYSKILWSMAAPDHVHPRSLGGATELSNLVTSCSGCNYTKGDLTLGQLNTRSPL